MNKLTNQTSNKTTYLIVNADDFGINEEVNNAISRSFENGIISSTSLLVNMPGFPDAIEKINANHLIKGNVGLHLNLMEGFPISDPIKKQKRFCEESGSFTYKRNSAFYSLDASEKKAVEIEIRAQLDRALKQGIKISHVDSHHGSHTEWSIVRILLNILNDYKIRKIRIARNMGIERDSLKEIYKFAFNSYLKFRNIKGVDLFGDLEDFFHAARKGNLNNKSIEIMIHPIAAENGTIQDLDYGDIKEKLKVVAESYRMVNYREL